MNINASMEKYYIILFGGRDGIRLRKLSRLLSSFREQMYFSRYRLLFGMFIQGVYLLSAWIIIK